MKNQKIILFFIVSFTFLLVNFAWAADTCPKDSLCFTPTITIPGFYTADQFYEVTPASLPEYIVAVYRYGGIFAGVVAMFMLVYAGWQWLLAGGNGSKISQAKEKINGVLMGLFLLFGGYLLLSLISERLVSFKTLQTQLPEVPCVAYTTESSCPKSRCHWEKANTVMVNSKDTCVDGAAAVPEIAQLDCGKIHFNAYLDDPLTVCRKYPDLGTCAANFCYGKQYYWDTAPLSVVCTVTQNSCTDLKSKRCTSNTDCNFSNTPDTREWCCEDKFAAPDTCSVVGPDYMRGEIDRSKCKS